MPKKEWNASLPLVEEVKYLGILFTRDERQEREIDMEWVSSSSVPDAVLACGVGEGPQVLDKDTSLY